MEVLQGQGDASADGLFDHPNLSAKTLHLYYTPLTQATVAHLSALKPQAKLPMQSKQVRHPIERLSHRLQEIDWLIISEPN